MIALVTTYLIRIPVGYLFGIYWGMGMYGMWIGMCVDITGRCVLNAYRYWSKHWMHVTVG